MRFLIFGERRITCRELDERVNRLANAMQSVGIGTGDKVGILLLNCPEAVEIFFAAAKIGAVNVPINIRLSPAEITYILSNSDTKLLFAGKNFLPVVEKIKNDLPLLEEVVVVHRIEEGAIPELRTPSDRGAARSGPKSGFRTRKTPSSSTRPGQRGRPRGRYCRTRTSWPSAWP